jgi:hypothetical protein
MMEDELSRCQEKKPIIYLPNCGGGGGGGVAKRVSTQTQTCLEGVWIGSADPNP